MDAERELWQRQLEQATGRNLAAGVELDPETAELREGWLALGRLIEAADREADGRVLSVQVSAPVAACAPRRRPRWWAPVALAASLLLIASVIWLGGRFAQARKASSSPPVAASPRSTSSPLGKTPISNEFSWDDSWEEQVAQVDMALATVGGVSYLGDASLSIVDEQLRQLGHELTKEL